jgi:hypothetical protein
LHSLWFHVSILEFKQISFPLWSIHFYTTNLKTLKTSNTFYSQLKEFTNYKTNTMVSTVNNTTINCNQSVCTITSVYLNPCKIIDVWHNSKFTIWSFDTWVDGDMRVWCYNEVPLHGKKTGLDNFMAIYMRVWRWIGGQ